MDERKVNAEILSVLMELGDKYISKIPKEIISYITNNYDAESMPYIDKNKRIEEQNISKDARVFLTMLKINYWCKTQEEKDKLIKLLADNEKKRGS